ncbi:Uncharacterized protein dnm_062260 [Desulfonema magnum]|uniref:Uncharacterized protein n=1 Tax=Desulfonema magnum TaxID=45655 RepID=A0A975GQR0_9BACT|nr:Uncharacterized protein dnm_062260 [Desulfonema magnum]
MFFRNCKNIIFALRIPPEQICYKYTALTGLNQPSPKSVIISKNFFRSAKTERSVFLQKFFPIC